jgi:hypothetical protein
MNKRHTIIRAITLSTCFGLILGPSTTAQAQPTEYDLMPLLQVERNRVGDEQTNPFISPVGGYVRFWIERVPPGGRCPQSSASSITRRDYDREARNPILRYLWGRSYSRILQAKLTVTRSTLVTQSVTLASASHDSSSRQGENWTSEMGERQFLTPYFRVDQGTTAAIEVRLKTTRETDAAITQNVLSLIRTGASLVAPPTAPLVTALNGDRLNKTSNYLDASISSLFRERLAETSQSDFPAENWVMRAGSRAARQDAGCDLGRAIANISAAFPMEGHVWRAAGNRDVGEWRIYVTDPIVSIFSPVPMYAPAPRGGSPQAVCLHAIGKPARNGNEATEGEALEERDRQACIAFMGLTPSDVLGLQVGENITLGQVLRGDTGISAALQRFASTSASNTQLKAQTAGREICIRVAELSQAQGLNAYDAAAAMWAFASNGGVAVEVSQAIWDGDCTASRIARRLRLDTHTDSTSSGTPQTGQGGHDTPGTGTPGAGH